MFSRECLGVNQREFWFSMTIWRLAILGSGRVMQNWQMSPRLALAIGEEANDLITEDPFALLFGMVLDQQFPLERAFSAPYELQQRLGRPYDVHDISEMDPERLESLFATPPALHRFPRANAQRVQALAHIIIDNYEGDGANIWGTAKTGAELLARVNALPGFGKRKAQIFVALLGKQFDVKPTGWRNASSPFGNKGTAMSIADITSPESLIKVRAWKKAQKALPLAVEPAE